MDHKPKKEDIELLYTSLLSLESSEDCRIFLDDLCTKKEVESMVMRLAAAKLLMEGKTYEQVMEATKISSATLARVSTCVRYGKGYQTILKKK